MTHDNLDPAEDNGSAAERLAGEIRRLRTEAGISQARLAGMIGYSPAYVSLAERPGKGLPSPAVVQAIDSALNASGSLVALSDHARAQHHARRHTNATAEPPREPLDDDRLAGLVADAAIRVVKMLNGDGSVAAPAADVDMWDRFIRAVDKPRRTDQEVVGHLSRVLAEYRQLEDVTGPRPIIEPIRTQLTLLDDLAANARAPVRDAVVESIGHHAQFAGWLAEDAGNSRHALAAYDRAMDAAQQVNDTNMVISVLSLKSHLAWSCRDAERAVALAQAGQQVNGQVSPGVLALIAQQEARGHALLGEVEAAEKSMDLSEMLTHQASQHPENEPAWIYFQDPGRALFQRGITYLELGRGQQAAELFEQARLVLPASYKRDHGRYLAVTAHAYAVAGDIEQATTLGRQAATLAGQTGSIHTANDLRRMRQALTPWNNDPRIKELDEYARTIIRNAYDRALVWP